MAVLPSDGYCPVIQVHPYLSLKKGESLSEANEFARKRVRRRQHDSLQVCWGADVNATLFMLACEGVSPEKNLPHCLHSWCGSPILTWETNRTCTARSLSIVVGKNSRRSLSCCALEHHLILCTCSWAHAIYLVLIALYLTFFRQYSSVFETVKQCRLRFYYSSKEYI